MFVLLVLFVWNLMEGSVFFVKVDVSTTSAPKGVRKGSGVILKTEHNATLKSL